MPHPNALPDQDRRLRFPKPSAPPHDFCERCLSRNRVYYDARRLQHLCTSCKADADRIDAMPG